MRFYDSCIADHSVKLNEQCVCMCHTRRASGKRRVGWPSRGTGGGVEGSNKRAGATPGVASARRGNITGAPTTTC
jgi:hypothetical protein